MRITIRFSQLGESEVHLRIEECDGNVVHQIFVPIGKHNLACRLTLKISSLCYPLQTETFNKQRADPKAVVSIILGGGAGTRLFPLTKTRAKPAVNLFVDVQLAKLQLKKSERHRKT